MTLMAAVLKCAYLLVETAARVNAGAFGNTPKVNFDNHDIQQIDEIIADRNGIGRLPYKPMQKGTKSKPCAFYEYYCRT
jgi:hypothetical protein